MNTSLTEMKVFATIAQTQSISGASERLNISVSAVSRILSRLEVKLNTELIKRTTRQLYLTEEGLLYLHNVQNILSYVSETEEMMHSRKLCPSGVLRINSAIPALHHVIVPIVNEYQSLYPDVTIEFQSDERNIDLLGNKTDIAVRVGELEDSTLNAIYLGKSKVRILASPNYLSKYGIPDTIESLKTHRLLGYDSLGKLNFWPLGAEEGLLKVEPHIKADSGETLRLLALNDCGIVCLSDMLTQKDISSGHLVEVLSSLVQPMFRPIYAVYYKNSATPLRVRSFLDFLKAKSSIEHKKV